MMKEIKGFKNYKATSDGRVWSEKTKRFLKQGLDGNGYAIVGLYKDGKSHTKSVHRLVAEAFLERELDKNQVNHKNGIKVDNRLENLEWNSNRENTIHAYKNKLYTNKSKGVRVFDIKNNMELKYKSIRQASKCLGLHRKMLTGILNDRIDNCYKDFKFEFIKN